MTATADFLKDDQNLLTSEGFAISNHWYHGTSSALVDSILRQGLQRSGDEALRAAAKKTMATIGNDYTETTQPVFLTPSKELASYWAEQTVRNRSVRLAGQEQPAVIKVTLPDAVNSSVQPDVGAASLLMLKEGEQYLAYLAGLYQAKGLAVPDINLMHAKRMDYLQQLGMAYIDQDLAPEWLELLNPS